MRPPGLARDGLLSLIAITIVGGSAAVYSVVVGRVLGPTALGHAGVALAIGLGGAQLSAAGIAPAITRFTAFRLAGGLASEARRAVVLGVAAALGVGVGVAVGVVLSAPAWSARVGLPANLVAPAALLIALQAAYIGLKAALYGLGRVGAYAWAEVAGGVAFAAGLAAVLAGGPVSLIAPFLWANAAFGGAAAVACRGLGARQAGRAGMGHWGLAARHTGSTAAGRSSVPSPTRFALIATVGSAAALARLQLPVIVTAVAWPPAEVGRLGAALAFLPPMLLVPRALELALLPALAGAWGLGDRGAFRQLLARASRMTAASQSLALAVLLIAGPRLLTTLFGPEFAAAGGALRAVVVAAWALGLAVPAVVALSASDGVAVPNAAGVAGLGVSLIVWSVLVPTAGATGAAIGLAAGSLVNAGVPLAVAARRFGSGDGG